MAITIKVNDANRDGKGIDFAAYLKKYDKTYLRDGYGSFNSADDMAMSGSQYATTDAKGYGAVLTAGKTKWQYDLATHKITGSIATVQFGSDIELNSKSKFDVTYDIQISGLNVTDKVLGGQILSAIMGGKNTEGGATKGLVDVLKTSAIDFKGSSGADAFTGYGKADKISGGAGNDILNGGAGNDKIDGGAGNDKIDGGLGNDTLDGGSGKDVFVFKKGQGKDTIKGFEAGSGKGDVIHLDDAVLKNFADVLAHARDTPKGVLIDYDKGSILLAGLDKADLHANDFFFF